MKRFGRREVCSLLAVVALGALGACGSDDDDSAETTPATAAPPATTAAPVATAAPATDPPATDAPATDAPATDAPATDAPATDAPATDAPATDPPETAPALSEAQADLQGFLEPPDELADWPAITGEIPADFTVYYMTAGNDTSSLIESGLEEATEILGWSYDELTVNPQDPTALNSAVLSAVQAGANAIVTTTAESARFAEGLAAAADAGVIVVQIGSTEPEAFTGVIDNINANSDQWGQKLAAAVVADAEERGVTVNVGAVTAGAFAQTDLTLQSFLDHLEAYCPDCTSQIIDAPIAELFTGQASISVISALQRDPDINYLHFGFGPTAIGVRPALDSVGYEDVRIIGMLPTPPQLQEMVDGGAAGWLVVPNRYDAFVAVDTILRAVTGGDPTIHNLELEPAWILQEDSDFDPTTLPELPIDYATEFAEIWGVA